MSNVSCLVEIRNKIINDKRSYVVLKKLLEFQIELCGVHAGGTRQNGTTGSMTGCLQDLNHVIEKIKARDDELWDKHQKEAMLYIVVVLSFYSLIIISLMIKYIRKERQEWTEDRMYRNFLNNIRLIALQESKERWIKRFSQQLQNDEKNRANSVDVNPTDYLAIHKSAPEVATLKVTCV